MKGDSAVRLRLGASRVRAPNARPNASRSSAFNLWHNSYSAELNRNAPARDIHSIDVRKIDVISFLIKSNVSSYIYASSTHLYSVCTRRRLIRNGDSDSATSHSKPRQLARERAAAMA